MNIFYCLFFCHCPLNFVFTEAFIGEFYLISTYWSLFKELTSASSLIFIDAAFIEENTLFLL
jgi:hypothetical protein